MQSITPNWPAPPNIKALTTTRQSWGENGTSQPAERNRLTTLFSLPSDPAWLKQIHSNVAVPADPEHGDHEADASYTDQLNRVCLVLTADCLPVLICNQQGTKVAAAHAGWRGLANGVIENTVAAMNTDPSQLLVWLGPAIGPEKFEVGADVYKAFVEKEPNAKDCFANVSHDKWLANLYRLATVRLKKIGINQIYGGEYCTHSQNELFYSYRRDKGQTGRMASVIWIDG